MEPKKVPWLNWNEWIGVYSSLESNPGKSLETMEVWKVRSSLPVMVEATRSILKVCFELTQTYDLKLLETLNLEAAKFSVGLCITRIVNQVCDLNFERGKSIQATAKALGISEYVVELRHSVTHGALPEALLLAKGLGHLYSWLIEHYWNHQASLYLENHEKVMRQLKRYKTKALITEDNYLVAKFLENLFPEETPCFRSEIAKELAKMRLEIRDEAWAILFVELQSKVKKLPEAVTQAFLANLKQERISLEKLKQVIEEVLTLSNGLKLMVTPCVKHLVTLQNTDKLAFEIVGLLVEHNVFETKVLETMTELRGVCRFSDKKLSGQTESGVPDLNKWWKVKTWDPKPLGCYSYFNNNN